MTLRSEDPAADRSHVVLPAAGEFEAGDAPQIDAEPELGVDRADGSIELETPAVKIPVQAVLLADCSARDQIEGGLVADLPVPGQVRVCGEVPGCPFCPSGVCITI
jgi:hypothetical protein